MTSQHEAGGPSAPDELDEVARRRADRAAERLRVATAALAEEDRRAQDADVTALLEQVTEQIRRESRAGRDVALGSARPGRALVVTEGALRSALRSAIDDVPDVLVGRVRLRGELERSEAPLGADLRISVRWRRPLAAAVDAARRAAARTLRHHTGRPLEAIDVAVVDVHVVGAAPGADGAEREDRP